MAFTPTFNTTQRATTQANLLNGLNSRRLFNPQGKIYELQPNLTPILSMIFSDTSKFGLTDPDFKFLEHRDYFTDKYYFYARSSGTLLTGGNSKTLDSEITLTIATTSGGSTGVGFVIPGMTIRVIDASDVTGETDAYLRIKSVNPTSTEIVCQLRSKATFDIAANDQIFVVGDAHAEGSSKTEAISDIVDVRWASAQTFKRKVDISNDAIKTNYLGGSELERLKIQELKVLWSNVERTLIWGNRFGFNGNDASTGNNPYEAPSSTSTTTTNVTRYTAGFKQCLTWANTNGFGNTTIFTPSMSTYTYSDFIDNSAEAFRFGSKSKTTFCGKGVISFINKMVNAEGFKNLEPRTTQWGFSVFDIITPHGTVKLVEHPLFTAYAPYSMLMLDMNNVGLGIFDELSFQDNIQDNGKDSKECQWMVKLGLMFALPETGSWWAFKA